jgi:hypothetical protein
VDLFNYNLKETIEFALNLELGTLLDGKETFEWKKVAILN